MGCKPRANSVTEQSVVPAKQMKLEGPDSSPVRTKDPGTERPAQ
jgi:hypothetical protein